MAEFDHKSDPDEEPDKDADSQRFSESVGEVRNDPDKSDRPEPRGFDYLVELHLTNPLQASAILGHTVVP